MVNVDSINLENMSMEDLKALEARVQQAQRIPAGQKAVALASMLKSVIAEIKTHDPEILGEAFAGITTQAMPKEANVGKRYGLSETQIENAKAKGAKLVVGL